MNNDLFLQIALLLCGAILGIVAQILKPSQQKKYLGILALVLFMISAAWISYNYINFGRLANPLAETDGIIWDATFYGNIELKDPPILQTTIKGAVNGLRVDWGINAPRSGMPVDFFSAIFKTTHNFTAGLYCFVIEVDDGARLFIDGNEVRNVWWGYTPGAIYKSKITLDEGPHLIQFYYYEETEKSSFHLFWYNKGVGSECVTIGHPGIQ